MRIGYFLFPAHEVAGPACMPGKRLSSLLADGEVKSVRELRCVILHRLPRYLRCEFKICVVRGADHPDQVQSGLVSLCVRGTTHGDKQADKKTEPRRIVSWLSPREMDGGIR